MLVNRLYDQNEDAATRALAALMRSEPKVLRAFVELVASEALSRRTGWTVSPQHRTFLGRRIDIFIRNGDFSIVVEAKVRDGIKSFQFDHYLRHVVDHETGCEPVLVWLVQRPRVAIGMNAAKAHLLTWNNLYQALSGLDAPGVQQFCADLMSCRIALPGVPKAREKNHKGYDPDFAVATLRAVAALSNGLIGDVEENTRTPLSLHVGRAKWKMHWRSRVWFYFQPLTDTKNAVAPFKFVCHLLLYNSENDLFEPARIKLWSRVMQSHGLILKRNQPGKWKKAAENLPAPVEITSKKGLRYVFGDPSDAVCRRFTFDWQVPKAALRAGHAFLKWGLGIIDECLEE